jgi:hypothetical protein
MKHMKQKTARCLVVGVILLMTSLSAQPVLAQGRGHDRGKPDQDKPKVTVQLTVSTAKDVLVKLGYEVVRVEPNEGYQIIYYRAGNRGRGRGQGPPARMIVRQVEDRVVLEDAPEQVRVELGVRLSVKF